MNATAVATNSPAIEEDHATVLRNLAVEILREEGGFRDTVATPIADLFVRGLRLRYGGKDIYIPAPSATERYAEIRAKHAELIGKHGAAKARDLVMQLFNISLNTYYRALNAK